jgi:magnesium-dependent phosphatase 1
MLLGVRALLLWTHAAPRSNRLRAAAAAGLSSSPPPLQPLPELAVFDLDACLWDKEMFEMTAVPTEEDRVLGDLNGRGEGVVGVMSGRAKISLNPGALEALQRHADGDFPGMKVALASSANTPFAEEVGRASLGLLEVSQGLTVWEVITRDWGGTDVNQIGRQPPLSPDKAATHFPRLRAATGVRFDRMLFFDDCNWRDHCGEVAERCTEGDSGLGPVIVRTPLGLQVQDFEKGLQLFAASRKPPPPPPPPPPSSSSPIFFSSSSSSSSSSSRPPSSKPKYDERGKRIEEGDAGSTVRELSSMDELESLVAAERLVMVKAYGENCPKCRAVAPKYRVRTKAERGEATREGTGGCDGLNFGRFGRWRSKHWQRAPSGRMTPRCSTSRPS